MRRDYVIAPYGIKVIFTDNRVIWNKLYGSDFVDEYTHGCTVHALKRGALLVGVFDRNWLTGVHECTHLAMLVLKLAGIKPTDSNSEPLAYLVDHLSGVCCKRLGLR